MLYWLYSKAKENIMRILIVYISAIIAFIFGSLQKEPTNAQLKKKKLIFNKFTFMATTNRKAPFEIHLRMLYFPFLLLLNDYFKVLFGL